MKKLFGAILLLLYFTAFAFADPSDGIIDSVNDLKSLKPGHWYTISGSSMRNNTPICADPHYSGAAYQAKVTSYSGAAHDSDTIYLTGAGHTDGGFNGTFGFDFNSLSWSCVGQPSENNPGEGWPGANKAYIRLHRTIIVQIGSDYHRFRMESPATYTSYGTTGPTEPDWSTADDVGDPINDGNVTWVNRGIVSWQAGYNYSVGDFIIGNIGTAENTNSGTTYLNWFKCASDSGNSDSTTEPDWSSAVDFNDTVDEKNSALTWTNMGIVGVPAAYTAESGLWPWCGDKAAWHSLGVIGYSDYYNGVVWWGSRAGAPLASGNNTMNSYLHVHDFDTQEWHYLNNDNSAYASGTVGYSPIAIDNARDTVWLFRLGPAGSLLWSYDLTTNVWTDRGTAGTLGGGSGNIALINPDRDEFVTYGYDDKTWYYGVWSIDPNDFDGNGHASQVKFFRDGITGTAPTGDWEGIQVNRALTGTYDTTQDIIAAWWRNTSSSDDIQESIYILLPDKHHWMRVPAAQGNLITPGSTNNSTFGRFAYIEDYNLYAYVSDRATDDVYVYKLSEDTKDNTAPAITDFKVPDFVTGKTIPISSFSATDTHQWTVKYAITESATAPSVSSSEWEDTVPSTHTTPAGDGKVTLYAYAMDMFGNISSPSSGTVTVVVNQTAAVEDTTTQTISTFSVQESNYGQTIPITVTASDTTAKWAVTESDTPPAISSDEWQSTVPTSYTTEQTNGNITLYAQEMDLSGNISSSLIGTVTIYDNQAAANYADFQARCSADGVLVCNGFDSQSDIQWDSTGIGSGFFWNGINPIAEHGNHLYDTKTKASGNGSAKFSTPDAAYFTYGGLKDSAGIAGQIRVLFNENIGDGDTVYIQYRTRLDSSMVNLTKTSTGGASGFKNIIVHENATTYGTPELTFTNYLWSNDTGIAYLKWYADGGWRSVDNNLGGGVYQMQQGDYSQCLYNSQLSRDYCFYWPADQWCTVYQIITIGNYGSENTRVTAKIAVGNQPYKTVFEKDDLKIAEGDINALTLTPYMNDRASDGTPTHDTAYVWYDELIVSTNPIAAPASLSQGDEGNVAYLPTVKNFRVVERN